MSDWHVQDGNDVKRMSEARLRKRLRKGDLTGFELARPDGSDTWHKLHDLSIFREEVPVAEGADGAQVAAGRAVQGFFWHLAVFLGVILFITANAGFPFWAVFWAIGLAAHGAKVVPALQVWGEQMSGAAAPQVAQTPAQPAPNAAAESSEPDLQEGFLVDLSAALTALAGAASPLQGPPPDVDGIRAAAETLHRRRQALEALADPDLLSRLGEERGAAATRRDRAPDDRTAEAYEEELRALDGRIDSIRAAVAQADRLAAKERALLHQVEGMRIAALQAAVSDEPRGPEIAAQADRLREEVRASGEVEEALARARRAAQRQRG